MFEKINMESKDIIMTMAIILGPILAIQAQKTIEVFQETRKRRMELFRTLMSTRADV